MRSRNLGALVFGLLTAALVWLYLQQASHRAPTFPHITAVVSAGKVEAGTVLTADMLKTVKWPEAAPLPGLISSPEEAAGKQVIGTLLPGQAVLAHDLIPPEALGFGGRIPLGMRLITVGIDEQLSIGYRLRPGDRVDILRVVGDGLKTTSDLILQRIQVFAIGAEGGNKQEPRTVTLLIRPEEALQVSVLAEEGSLRILLRATGDTQTVNAERAQQLR